MKNVCIVDCIVCIVFDGALFSVELFVICVRVCFECIFVIILSFWCVVCLCRVGAFVVYMVCLHGAFLCFMVNIHGAYFSMVVLKPIFLNPCSRCCSCSCEVALLAFVDRRSTCVESLFGVSCVSG